MADEHDEHGTRVIRIGLERIEGLFELPPTDLFSEYRNYLTGIELILSELRAHPARDGLRIEIELPPEAIDASTVERARRGLERYCDQRTRYNRSEGAGLRRDGTSALRIGLPITAVGLALSYLSTHDAIDDEGIQLIAEHLGWVLAWVGLWYPLDHIFFYPFPYRRESRALAEVRSAELVIVPAGAGTALRPG